MDPTSARDLAFRLAASDWREALALARRIDEPWFKCQAPGAVARRAPDKSVTEIAPEAVAAAMSDADAYNAVGAAAWPIRALIERGFASQAASLCRRVLDRSGSIVPSASRAEALFHVFQAVFAVPVLRSALAGHLGEVARGRGWRVGRNLRDAVLMLASVDREESDRLLSRMPEGAYRRQAERGLATSTLHRPRSYFGWE